MAATGAVIFAPVLAVLLWVGGGALGEPTDLIQTGAERLVQSGFKSLAGKRVGLITNHTGRIGDQHLADVLARASGMMLAAILAPEHGFRGSVEAGAKFQDGRDERTGAPVLSLYGKTRKPTPDMLRGIDVLVFDIQDVGVRFYTYISTMGLAMQAAAEARIPFVVLDRPNPLGGTYVSGFVMERARRSFVGRYEIPIAHGMTVGELAQMIKGQALLDGLANLDLTVVAMQGWRRSMRWPELGRPWVATSPNIPIFGAALVYPGIGLVGELLVSEGRGTPTPFLLFGAPWLDGPRMVAKLEALRLPGVRFTPETYTPRPIPGVATNPRFAGQRVEGIRVTVTDVTRYEPLEVGIHVLDLLTAEARGRGLPPLIADPAGFDRIAGTARLREMLAEGVRGAAIIAAWRDEVARFRERRKPYLLY